MVEDKKTDFNKIEKKWQEKWEEKKIFEVSESGKKKKYYVLEMFPYPSGAGLHMGHALNYTIGDIFARFKRMSGFNVLYPMGYDAFGLPAENAAIKAGEHPKKYTEKSMKNFIQQQKALGLSYDWSRLIATCDPEYYKWNQYLFLKLLENGLVYRKKSAVNWCPKCDTVLANEQVHGGMCWRHEDTPVEMKQLEQWFIKTTKYSDELLEKVGGLQWPDRIKTMQENWIGKSHGTEIDFEIPTNVNFVLLHGYKGSPDTNFFPWLKKELESRGYGVSVPKLPDTNNPKIMEQVEYVLENCKFNENTVLLGHSLGSVVALKVLESLKKPIKKLVLAAGLVDPNSKDKTYINSFDWKFDFNKIKNNVKEILILKDINDKEIRKDSADKIKNAIGGEIVAFEAENQHICGDREPVVLDNCLEKWPIFTTRPDTLFGVTFMVVSAQHPKLIDLVTGEQKKKVEDFLKKLKSVSEKELEDMEKEGVFTGSYATNPLTKEKVPVYAGNFVVADYGAGMVMAVPAHDQRDWEFAKKYKISVKQVIGCPDSPKAHDWNKGAYTDWGNLVNSGKFNGMRNDAAKEEITKELENIKLGRKTVNYKFRDWLVSRQRYWGTPIPIIYCDKCGLVPVSEKDLPVLLPEKVEFGKGNPLATNKDFVNVKCPKCGGKGRRETDTMDTFFDSSWYFLRFCDPKNKKEAFDRKKVEYWMPIDQYIGGAEHACMHLIYARFFTKALRDFGLINMDEPFIKLFNQGMLHGADGNKMSKSLGNVINPMDVIGKFSADSLRFNLMSLASPDRDSIWSDGGMESSYNFVNKINLYFENMKIGKSSEKLESKINKAIKEITLDIENFAYNLALIKLRALVDVFIQESGVSKRDAESFLKLISPFCPHIAEELWSKMGDKSFISLESWPVADESKINAKLEEQEKAVDKLGDDILNILRIVNEKESKTPGNAYLYTIPPELVLYKENKEMLEKKTNLKISVFAVNDKAKYDPQNKAGKAKPGKPAVYLE
jgi:leucyl-tRNA synthetase